MFSVDRDRNYPSRSHKANRGTYPHISSETQIVPELLDTAGNLIKDPLLVMRSISVEDAREQLDAPLYASPGYKGDQEEA